MFPGIFFFFFFVISENMLWSRNLGQKMGVSREAQPPGTSIIMYAVNMNQTQELKTCYIHVHG